jgi:hypothetical protein
MVYAKIPAASLFVVQAVHEQSKRDQFLMKLRPEFEVTHSNLMNQDPSPSLDVCFGELLREEQGLLTQATFQQDSNPNPVAYAAYGKWKGKDMRKVQCFSYKKYCHIGVAKRKNRHLLDIVRTLLLESSVPSKFWVGALSIAVYLINGLPSQVLNFDSPYYRLYHQHPSYLNPHTFGCVCFVHLSPHERHKLFAQFVKCAFMGYSISHKGYVCYDSCSNKFRIPRNIVFFENQHFFSTHVESLLEISILPCFDELTPLPKWFKPEIVYTRHLPTFPFPKIDPSSKTA